MKKLILACCAACLLVTLSGCANGDSIPPNSDNLHHAPGGPGPIPDAPNF